MPHRVFFPYETYCRGTPTLDTHLPKVFSLFPLIHTMASIARLQPSIVLQPYLYSVIGTSSRCSSRPLVSRPVRPSQLAAVASSRGITRTFAGSVAGDCIPDLSLSPKIEELTAGHTHIQCEKRNTPKTTNGLSSPQMATPVH